MIYKVCDFMSQDSMDNNMDHTWYCLIRIENTINVMVTLHHFIAGEQYKPVTAHFHHNFVCEPKYCPKTSGIIVIWILLLLRIDFFSWQILLWSQKAVTWYIPVIYVSTNLFLCFFIYSFKIPCGIQFYFKFIT